MFAKMFGVSVDEIVDVVLEQMAMEGATASGIFVVHETSRLIARITPDESAYVESLGIETHTGSNILRQVQPEIDRRTKGRRVIAELLRKLGRECDTEAVETAWQKSETHRRTAGPRIVAPRIGLRTEPQVRRA